MKSLIFCTAFSADEIIYQNCVIQANLFGDAAVKGNKE
jgi:hypothetical protein